MTKQDEIRAIKARIAKSESDTHTWRVSGYGESCIQAYDDADAEELQLETKLAESKREIEKSRRPVFKSLNAVSRATVTATDGIIGSVTSALFDDKSWAIRYLVVDAGTWLSNRKVLISPYSVKSLLTSDKNIDVTLTRQQVRSSPDMDAHRPVTRQHEREYLRHYAYPEYWEGGGMWGIAAYPVMRTHVPSPTETEVENAIRELDFRADDVHLLNSDEVTGCDIQATDESIGHVKDFIFDEASWVIRYLVVDTRNWWPGGKIVLVATPWIESIDWDASIVRVKLARKQVMNSPEYVDATMIDRDYEQRLHDAHERDGYWLSQSRDTSLERRLTDGAN